MFYVNLEASIEFIVPDRPAQSFLFRQGETLESEGDTETDVSDSSSLNGDPNFQFNNYANVAEESLFMNEYGSEAKIIAPGEGKRPIPLYEDRYAEEMSFPKIYCGEKRKIIESANISYTDIAKSESLREDRRAAGPSKILYSMKKSFNEKMRSCVQVYLRKKRGTTKVTAKQARNKDFVASLLKHDEGYQVWKNLRSSPSYWAGKSKEVIAMIRQLGKCTFFITLSAAETKWNELIIGLKKLQTGELISENDAKLLSSKEKADLIRSDPVTCMRNFERRIRKAHTLLFKKSNGIVFLCTI